MTDDQVISGLVRYLAALTGLRVIRTHESGKAPALPYLAVNFTGSAVVRQHEAATEYTNTHIPNSAGKDTIKAVPVTEMEWRFSVHSYGSEPSAPLRRVVAAQRVNHPLEATLPGLVIHDHSTVRSVPDWINNAWEPRAQIDLFVRGITRDDFTIDVIDQASFDTQPMA